LCRDVSGNGVGDDRQILLKIELAVIDAPGDGVREERGSRDLGRLVRAGIEEARSRHRPSGSCSTAMSSPISRAKHIQAVLLSEDLGSRARGVAHGHRA
jgi:hypothetical protein